MRKVLLILLFVLVPSIVVIFFSEAEGYLVCKGETKVDGQSSGSDSAFISMKEYRWWVGLWSEKSGNATVQFDQTSLQLYFDDVLKIGDGPLTQYAFINGRNKFSGGFRSANNEIVIEIAEGIVFVGRCTRT
jgi:hypothetical protein